MAKPEGGKPPASAKVLASVRPPAAGKGGTNPALTAQARKVMGKHYAAKYGVRKERG